ncbi:MAG: hypothetical protein DRO05_04645 [Thermoproteota archaeon]|nr:MAG: hypothetical protein DRO05_04645 [Candidatus Korarchaeota archaeon]
MGIRAALSETVITPPVGIPLTGFMERDKVSQGVHDDLYARALVLEEGDEIISIVSLDLVSVDREFVVSTRQLINEMTGIPEENIMIAATHIHSSPNGFLPGWGFKITKFPHVKFVRCRDILMEPHAKVLRDYLRYKVAGLVYETYLKLEDAKIGFRKCKIHKPICVNRDDPKGIFDPDLVVMIICDDRNDVLGLLFNYACHPTVLGYTNYLYSSDFLGYAIRLIKNSLGEDKIILFLNGACGDVSTRFTRREQTFREAKRLGYILGTQVLLLAEETECNENIEVRVASKEIVLPLRSLPKLEELEKEYERAKKHYRELRKKGASKGELRLAFVKLEGLRDQIERVKLGISGGSVICELQSIRIGNSIFLGVPGELSSKIAINIKREAPVNTNVIIVGFANGYLGYILPREEYEKESYEALMSLLDIDAADILYKESLELLNL